MVEDNYYQRHKEQVKARVKLYRQKHCKDQKFKENRRMQVLRWNHRKKIEVLTHYGNGKLACVICGEERLPCLSIDHIDGDGNKHRREIGARNAHSFYIWLRQQGFPVGYQTLCMNCQFVKMAESRESLKKPPDWF